MGPKHDTNDWTHMKSLTFLLFLANKVCIYVKFRIRKNAEALVFLDEEIKHDPITTDEGGILAHGSRPITVCCFQKVGGSRHNLNLARKVSSEKLS